MIYLGIGSNLSSSFGNRFANINFAISFLEEKKINLVKKSSFYETFSYPKKENPKFINIVIAVKTSLPPKDLMQVLISIEEKLERKRLKKNDPRTCDIDIIDYNREIINSKSQILRIPFGHTYYIDSVNKIRSNQNAFLSLFDHIYLFLTIDQALTV